MSDLRVEPQVSCFKSESIYIFVPNIAETCVEKCKNTDKEEGDQDKGHLQSGGVNPSFGSALKIIN